MINQQARVAVLLVILFIAGYMWWFHFRPEFVPTTVELDDPLVRARLSQNKEKVLVIGIDGMTWSIALDLINEGRMPNLARLFASTPHGVMLSEPPLISPAIWTTFATGHKRSQHGINNFLTKLPGKYKEVDMTSRFRTVPAVWNMMNWAGRTVSVVNWNAAYPAEEVKGVFVAHGINQKKMKDDMIYPPDWRARIRSLVPVSFDKMETNLKEMTNSQARNAYDNDRFVYTIAKEILSELHPDLMMVYLSGVDVVSHIYWKYRYPLSMEFIFNVSQKDRELYQNVIENHYEFVDVLVGELIEEADGYTIFIISDHGMGPHYPPSNYYLILNSLLERMGYLFYGTKSCEKILAEMANQGVFSIPAPFSVNIFMLSKALVMKARQQQNNGGPMVDSRAVEQWLRRIVGIQINRTAGTEQNITEKMRALAESLKPGAVGNEITWSCTAAWNIEDIKKNAQGIFINLENRDEKGIIPFNEYQTFQRKLIGELGKLRTEKDRPLFISVNANNNKVEGNTEVADIPDILVRVNPEALTDTLVFRGEDDHDPIPMDAIRWIYQGSGDHLPDGVFIAAGANIEGFRRLDVSLYDIAPTIIWSLGFPVGKDMPGRILKEAFIEPVSDQDPMIISSWTGVAETRKSMKVSAPDEERLQQLRALGYIQP